MSRKLVYTGGFGNFNYERWKTDLYLSYKILDDKVYL